MPTSPSAVKTVTLDGESNKKVSAPRKQLRVAYTIQNVGGIDFSKDLGDTVPVKYTLLGLRQAGHKITCFILNGRSVAGLDDISVPGNQWEVSLGPSGNHLFQLFERFIRKFQQMLALPYFAFFDSYRFYNACRQILPNYDLCHEHNGLFSVGTALACSRLKIPYVLTFSADPLMEYKLIGNPLRGPHAWVAAKAAHFTYKAAQKIICVSEPAKQHLVQQWQVDPQKIVVMPNGVDINLFGATYNAQEVRAELGLRNAPVISFVGGFQLWHGLDNLVASFAQVLAEIPEAKLLLVGDGPARPVVEQKIAELGLANSVTITGVIPQVQVPKMLSVVDIATIPYPKLPKELWFSPLKLYEYMAAGKAIVASRAGQIAEVIEDDRTGLLVESGDIDGFAQAILRLLKDSAKRKRLSHNAQQQAIARHSWEQYIRRLEEIYLSVL